MVAGILAALCVSPVFAAEKDMQAPPEGPKTTTTWHQDQKTQAEARKENTKFDQNHGYTNMKKANKAAQKEAKYEAKHEAKMEKVEKHNTKDANHAWKQDQKTQSEALKENSNFDKNHGYTNMEKVNKSTQKEAKHEAKMEKMEKKDAESANKAWKKDQNTQSEALKENSKFDQNHGYNNMPQSK